MRRRKHRPATKDEMELPAVEKRIDVGRCWWSLRGAEIQEEGALSVLLLWHDIGVCFVCLGSFTSRFC